MTFLVNEAAVPFRVFSVDCDDNGEKYPWTTVASVLALEVLLGSAFRSFLKAIQWAEGGEVVCLEGDKKSVAFWMDERFVFNIVPLSTQHSRTHEHGRPKTAVPQPTCDILRRINFRLHTGRARCRRRRAVRHVF